VKPIALYYLGVLDLIRDVARGMGYAIGLHGSLQRDFDLIAVPWCDEAKPAEELVEAIRCAIGGACAPIETSFSQKPHGRRAWSIYFTGGDALKQCTTPIIDLSVMPRLEQAK
jgi:hypothetical protein